MAPTIVLDASALRTEARCLGEIDWSSTPAGEHVELVSRFQSRISSAIVVDGEPALEPLLRRVPHLHGEIAHLPCLRPSLDEPVGEALAGSPSGAILRNSGSSGSLSSNQAIAPWLSGASSASGAGTG